MRQINIALSLTLMIVGLGIAGWAPIGFEMVSGHTLPIPAASDASAMTVWAGVAFLGVCGVLLAGMGAVALACMSRSNPRRAVQTVMVGVFGLAAAMTAIQQTAIWSGSTGAWMTMVLLLGAGVSLLNLLSERPSSIASSI